MAKISGPMLDRIDLTVAVQPVAATEISRAPAGEASCSVAARIACSRARQHHRQDGLCNAEASPEHFPLSEEARSLGEQAADRLHLSARGFTRLLRVSRTIADLEGCETVQRPHVAEALAYRHRTPVRT